jgi:serine protease Do
MKKLLFTTLVLGCSNLCLTVAAQQDIKEVPKDNIENQIKPDKKERQEIIIKSNGDKEIKLNVDIDGDKITINGKPLSEFKDKDVTINKRKMIIRDGSGEEMTFNFDGDGNLARLNGRLKELYKNENFQRTFLGVTTEKAANGARIVEVSKGSPAEKAGLKKDDIITKAGEENVTDGEKLAEIIRAKKPKDAVKIYYSRQGKNKDATAVLGEKAGDFAMNFNYKHPNALIRSFKTPMPAMPPMTNMDMNGTFNFDGNEDMLADVFPRQKKLGLKIQDTEEGGNVKVIEVQDSSAAEKAGLKKDDIITEINGEKISNTDDAREQLQEVAEKSAYTIKAKRNGTEMSFEVKIPKKLKTANL